MKGQGRRIAIVIFYDDKKNIWFQERGEHSKAGEKYGFFGGGIEAGETPDEALRRELLEEIDYIPKDLTFWTENNFTLTEGAYKNWFIESSVYLSKVTDGLKKARVIEGNRIVKMNIQSAIKNSGFHKADVELLKKLQLKLA